jgi:hypothetical protein
MPILQSKQSLQISLFCRNDTVANEQQRWHQRHKNPWQVERERNADREQGLTDVVGIS